MSADARKPIVLENPSLKVEIDCHDLTAHVTTKSTGQTLHMAAGQPDDVLINTGPGTCEWKSFAGAVGSIRRPAGNSAHALLPSLGIAVTIRIEDEDVVFEVAPFGIDSRIKARDVLYPRHFLLPRQKGAYATFPFSQGSIIPADWDGRFHHREGYAEAVAEWLGGYTGQTGYCGIAETPNDLYQAVHHDAGQPAGVFFHWLGSLGELRYTRVARYRFAKGLDYVKQARHYREYMKQIGWWRSLQDKVAENPNVKKLIGAPIVNIDINSRRERTMQYSLRKFADAAAMVENFRKTTGIANAVVHVDGWGFWGYDAMHPDVLPPNREAGGVGGLSDMAKRVKDLGYLFGLHDQYIDYYFHAPSYDEANSIVLDNGKPVRINNWCGGPCGHLCYTQIPPYVQRNYYEGVRRNYPLNHNSPSIWEICKPTASYLDCFCRGGVECFSKDHPMTRTENRQVTNEIFRIVRNGKDGQMVALSCEHPRGYSVPWLDFGWGIGHFSADVPNMQGTMETKSIGIPVPLWHLVYHDALCLPSGGDLLEALLYAQAPYFFLSREGSDGQDAAAVVRKKVLLSLHEDAAFADMCDHKILDEAGLVQRCVYDSGLEVEVNKSDGTYRINTGRAATKGWTKL
jgi:hypothetical protein